MKYNDYEIYKTARKTAKFNNILFSEDIKACVDLSLLAEADIDTFIYDDILKHIKYLNSADSYMYFGKEVNAFYYFDGIIKFYPLRIYDKDMCKRKYVIFIAQKAQITKVKRMSIYTEWERQQIQVEKIMSGYEEEVAVYE